jgi:Sugar kinases, ribokinase family
MSQYDIYGIGAALVDTEIEVNETQLSNLQIEKGVMTLVDEARQAELIAQLADNLVASKRASGGSAANSIIAASYFGAKTFYSCRVAADDNGDFYLRDLADAGVSYHNNNGSRSGITGKCLVMITADAERTMNTFLGISEYLSVEDIDSEALANSQYVYIEGYLVTSATGKPAAIELRQQAKSHGVKTALSLSDPAIVNFFRDGLVEMVGDGVDIIFCNEAEALTFTQTDSFEDACSELKKYCRSFAITRGAKGAHLFDGNNSFDVASPEVKAIDTNGAGDMFAGAFLFGLSRGDSFQTCAELATRAAAQVVTQFGPRLRAEQHAKLLG